MPIEELPKEERKLRVPTPEKPVYRRALSQPNRVVRFIGCYEGVIIEDDYALSGKTESFMGAYSDPAWQPIRPTFEPCEPEYEEPELKLPFVRRFRSGDVIAFYKLDNANRFYCGCKISGPDDSIFPVGMNPYTAHSYNLRMSTPVRITGPTRKPAEVRYPALYRDEDGHEWVAKSEALCLCVDPHSVRFGHHGHGEDGHPAADVQDLELVTDHPDFPQPAGEWELPFAVKHFASGVDVIAFEQRERERGPLFRCVDTKGQVYEHAIFDACGKMYPAYQPTTIG